MIEFVNVSKVYDNGTKALNNVSLKIDKGEFVFVVGASGAGKSTFLKLIMKEEDTTKGRVLVNGYDLSKIKRRQVPYMRRTMGIVFQDFRLISKMTVFDNVAFPMRIIGCRKSQINERVKYVLSLVGLENKEKCYPSELSGGERQRVGLARALVNSPPMIIADEPTGNIDPEMSYDITELLTKINETGTTVVMVTHEHELVRRFNKRVIVIDEGSVVSDSVSSECEYTEEKRYSKKEDDNSAGAYTDESDYTGDDETDDSGEPDSFSDEEADALRSRMDSIISEIKSDDENK